MLVAFVFFALCSVTGAAQTAQPTNSVAIAATAPATLQAAAPQAPVSSQKQEPVGLQLLHIIGCITGYNVLLAGLQKLFSKAATPNGVKPEIGPALTGPEQVADIGLSVLKVLAANPTVKP